MAASVVADRIKATLKRHNDFLSYVGAITVSLVTLRTAASLWRGFRTYMLSPLLGLGADLKSFGSWAVVTGSTDGIGKAYALELARQGLNVVLISRSAEKLKGVAAEIESKYYVNTKCVAVDFTGGVEIYDFIAEQLADLDVGILINNVGIGYEYPTEFLKLNFTNQEIMNIIHVNCNSVTLMTRLVLPKMLERKKGVIVNLSSLSGGYPTPLYAVYSASKAYIDFFTRCVRAEHGSKGIIIQSLLPGYVITKLSGVHRSTPLTPVPETYARSAAATIGVQSRSYGYWSHAIQALCTFNTMPEWLYNFLSLRLLRGLEPHKTK